MANGKKRCAARLKNRRRCPNQAKPEYQGYCGSHRVNARPIKAQSGKLSEERVALLVGAAAALVELTEKAHAYLPTVIEVLVEASRVLFWKAEDEPIQTERERPSRPIRQLDPVQKYLSMKISPKQLSSHIDFLVEERSWQSLANSLAYDFEVKIMSGNVPSALLQAIMEARNALLKDLRKLGYEPGNFTAERPIYVPTADS